MTWQEHGQEHGQELGQEHWARTWARAWAKEQEHPMLVQTGGIRGTRKHIGTPEVWHFFLNRVAVGRSRSVCEHLSVVGVRG